MKAPAGPSISLGPDGFTTANGTFVAWLDVNEVVAYKEDCWATDEIHPGFARSEGDRLDCVNESAAGYDELLAALPEAFSGIRTDWFMEVAFPAFEVNWTVLWRRASVVPA
jgi:hypothetical protein